MTSLSGFHILSVIRFSDISDLVHHIWTNQSDHKIGLSMFVRILLERNIETFIATHFGNFGFHIDITACDTHFFVYLNVRDLL